MRAVTRGCASADDCYLCQCKAIETLGLAWLAALLWHHLSVHGLLRRGCAIVHLRG